ncbi:hypothetical protein DAEQUDRAFT_679008 [Daedalea quercina L-15889]|uniref:RNase H type-1 domain-containing protein n=1 Tax=Daedalea quercina L-15889 TaxID=1314783 RepID=A0A165LB89_9APHY|nr:hypothetical protein DAEQUDRAFT_679008 [Daedalea quercina L-15889]
MAGLSWAARDVTAYTTAHPELTIRHLYFFADNTSAISTIFETRTSTAQGYSRTFRELIIQYLDAHQDNKVTVEWTPGHEGITGNELADQLAKDAADLAPPHKLASRASARRRAKERAHKAWIDEWKNSPPGGRFATANRLPPTDRPRKHFRELKREVFGRVTQCRTGHGHFGEYYHHHVPTEPEDCPCGAPLQTRQHILRDCPRYEPHRDTLRTASEHIDLPTILGTENGIKALAKFIERSGAFTKTGEPPGPRNGAEGGEGDRGHERDPPTDEEDDANGDAGEVGEVAYSDDEDDR